MSEVAPEGSLAQFACIVTAGDDPITLQWVRHTEEQPLFEEEEELDYYALITTKERLFERSGYEDNIRYRRRLIVAPSSPSVLNVSNEVGAFDGAMGNIRYSKMIKMKPMPRETRSKSSNSVSMIPENNGYFMKKNRRKSPRIVSLDNEIDIIVHQLSSKLSILMIPNIKYHHTGYYTCQASNSLGRDEFTTHLLVQGASALGMLMSCTSY